MGRISSSRSFGVPSGKIPSQSPPSQAVLIRFSFKHLDLLTNSKFSLSQCAEGYLEKLLVRLRDVNTLSIKDFRTNRSKALRIHPIDFEKTSEKGGFGSLNEQLRSEEAWQFEISSNEHGRIHGFLIDDTFYVVWLDPKHLLYS